MTDPNKTVFISYRRSTSQELARSIFMHLKYNGYDAFFDVNTMDNGAFDDIILNQIGARTHFISIISKGAFERCVNEGDWVRREIEEALRLGRNVVPIIWENCDFAHETNFLPAHIREDFRRLSGLPLTHFYFDSGMGILTDRFLKPPTHAVKLKTISAQEQRQVEQRKAQIETPPPPSPTPVGTAFLPSTPPQIFTPPIPSFLPKPFEWCKIDGGNVTLKGLYEGYMKQDTTVHVPDFFMAKYPVTNAQYQVFVDAPDGYKNLDWWHYSEGAKAWRKANPKPKHTAFVGDDHPRTNITWYESVAFTLWMSNKLSLNIHLPTDEQWQRAAIGDKNWAYPYGNEFDKNRCNLISKGTTLVTQYPNGASPFGVMDMSGNVWEWCFTSYDKGNIPLKDAIDEQKYVLRGGSWGGSIDVLRAVVRSRFSPSSRGSAGGMRLALSQ